MAESAWRPLMCAGVLVGGLVVAGPVAGVAVADTGASDDGGTSDGSDSGDHDRDRKPGLRVGSRNDDGFGARRRLGFGRGDRDRTRESYDGARDPGRIEVTVPGVRYNLPVPHVRLSVGAASERTADDCAGSCLATLRVGTPAASASVSLYSGAPEPEPEPPGPAFRGGPGEEEQVVDAAGNGDPWRHSAGAPGVLEVPMIVAAPPVAASVVGMSPVPAVAPGVPAAPSPSTWLFGIQSTLPAPTSGGLMTVTAPGLNASALPGTAGGPATRLGLPSATRPGGPARQLAAALPGLFGLFLVTMCGGFIGYRQANAGRYLRAEAAGRFLG